jgi:hypothetical protein
MGEVKEFPKSSAERAALRKAKADQERQRLINAFVVEDGNAVFVSADDIAYADVHSINGCRQTWPVRSTQFRMAYVRYLKRQMDKASTTADSLVAVLLRPHLSKRRVNEAIEEFELQAQGSGLVRDVHLRVAEDSGDLYIDLCDPDWQAIRVTAAGWQVVQSPPVRFRRTPGMLPLPFPERGATIDALRPFLNIPPGDIHIVVAWLLAALRDRGPYPILVLTGEHGSAKSTFGRILRSLIDPNRVALATLPPSGRDLFIAAHNARAIMFENVSKRKPNSCGSSRSRGRASSARSSTCSLPAFATCRTRSSETRHAWPTSPFGRSRAGVSVSSTPTGATARTRSRSCLSTIP